MIHIDITVADYITGNYRYALEHIDKMDIPYEHVVESYVNIEYEDDEHTRYKSADQKYRICVTMKPEDETLYRLSV